MNLTRLIVLTADTKTPLKSQSIGETNMSRSYPIWNDVTACIYQSSKSYGVKNDGMVNVKIGTSASNSHAFLDHRTTHKTLENGDQEFRFFVDGVLIKRAVVSKKEKTMTVLSTEEAA